LTTFDDLDKKIIQCLSVGTSSYEELAKQCNVTRNTVYRRISALEDKGIIKNTLHCIVNLDQLDITTVTINVKVPQSNQDKAITLLAINKNVRLLWRTYGDHNLILVAFCCRGKEGEVIQELKSLLEELNAESICVSVGYVWEKMSLSPFEEENKENFAQIIFDAEARKKAVAVLG
jgi:DNA-binding Lrp family transcriptional regulator